MKCLDRWPDRIIQTNILEKITNQRNKNTLVIRFLRFGTVYLAAIKGESNFRRTVKEDVTAIKYSSLTGQMTVAEIVKTGYMQGVYARCSRKYYCQQNTVLLYYLFFKIASKITKNSWSITHFFLSLIPLTMSTSAILLYTIKKCNNM